MPGVGNAVLMILLDINHFAGKDQFLQETEKFLSSVRQTPKIPGVAEIILPGDMERKTREQRLKTGIQIPDGTWIQIKKLAEEYKVEIPR